MSVQSIVESGMTFGPYTEGHCFYIEKSGTYKKVQDGVRMAEFLLLRFNPDKPSQAWIIEAKSSSPQPQTQPNFKEYIDEIREKLTNGLGLFVASLLNRHESARRELSAEFKSLDLETCGFRLVLIIHGHENEWLPPLQDALTKSLHSIVKTWALGPSAVAVLNEEGARKHRLIS